MYLGHAFPCPFPGTFAFTYDPHLVLATCLVPSTPLPIINFLSTFLPLWHYSPTIQLHHFQLRLTLGTIQNVYKGLTFFLNIIINFPIFTSFPCVIQQLLRSGWSQRPDLFSSHLWLCYFQLTSQTSFCSPLLLPCTLVTQLYKPASSSPLYSNTSDFIL